MLYASIHPERVEALFLQSPPAEDFYDPDFKYDIYNIRTKDDAPDVLSKKEVDAMIAAKERGEHMMASAHSVPHWLLRSIFRGEMKKLLSPELFTAEETENAACYWALMMQRHGKAEVVFM